MSAHGYQLEKEHPYRFTKALKDHLKPTSVSVPPYSFEALPFRWLSRETVDDELWLETDAYRPEREDATHRVIGFKPGWLMDGENQRAMIDRFFADVVPDQSLVLIYLKHSPLQEESTRRLLVGAARRSPRSHRGDVESFWDAAFRLLHVETIVSHSLRPDQKHGVLLPYQALVPRLEAGEDIGDALAWARTTQIWSSPTLPNTSQTTPRSQP